MMKKLLKGAIFTIGLIAAGSAAGARSDVKTQPAANCPVPEKSGTISSSPDFTSQTDKTPKPQPLFVIKDCRDGAERRIYKGEDGRNGSFVLACAPQTDASAAGAAAKKELYDMLSPELISFYEKEIAGAQVVSQIKPAKLERVAKRLNISVQKLKAVYIMQDLALRNDVKANINDLAALSETDFFKQAKAYAEKTAASMSPERKEALKKSFMELMKK